MADNCSNLNSELAQIDAELAALDRIDDQIKAEALAKADAPKNEFRTFSMVDGTKVRINPMEFWKDVERLKLDMGDEALKAEVKARFEGGFKPKGSKGLAINYSTLPFDDDTVALLLETIGMRRRESKAGRELMMPWSAEVASNAMAAEIATRGGNVEEIARDMARRVKGYDKLPLDMSMSFMMRNDTTRHLADMLDDVATMTESMGVPTSVQHQLARAAQYAFFFEQLDAMLSRKVGQALQARSKRFTQGDFKQLTAPIDERQLNYEDVRIQKLGPSMIEEGSLIDQIQRAINTGDAPALKKLAMAKRFDATQDVPLNKPNFFTEMELLNAYRKENLFSSSATLYQRNFISGGLVNFAYGIEDVLEYAYKNKDLGGAVRMAEFSIDQVAKGWGTAWRNATNFLNTGEATFTKGGVIEQVRMADQATRKDDAYAALNVAWDGMFGRGDQAVQGAQGLLAKPLTFMRWVNAGSRVFIGEAVEKLSRGNSTAGYSPVWSVMGFGDEINKKLGFDWKAGAEAYQQATDLYDNLDYKPELPRSEWIALKAEDLAEDVIFSGVATDAELNEMRQGLGARQYGDKSNEALRLELFNKQNGLPDTSNPIAQAGIKRGEDATFTAPLEGLGKAIDGVRKAWAPLSWVQPVQQTPWNGLKWALDRDLYIAGLRWVGMEVAQAASRQKVAGWASVIDFSPSSRLAAEQIDELLFTPQQMASARAKVTVAAGLAMTVNRLHAAGVFTDGGPFNPGDNRDERERNQFQPYSFSLGLSFASQVPGGVLKLAKLVIPGQSIDIVDLMGVQADVSRAWSEGRISEAKWNEMMMKIVLSYTRLLGRQNTLEGTISVVNVLTNTQATGNEKAVRLLQAQMNGIVPMSGALRDMSQGFRDPNVVADDGRRTFTEAEKALLEGEEFGWLREFYQSIFKDIPVAGQLYGARYSDRDWMGRRIEKPMGLPIDVAQPFMPILVPNAGLDQWMDELGLGGVPFPDGKLTSSDLNAATGITGDERFGSATMTWEEEKVMRKGMYSAKGDLPAQYLLGESNTFITTTRGTYDLNQYVQGNTLEEALEALRADPEWNYDMKERGIAANSPKAMALPLNEQSLAGRTRAGDLSRSVAEVDSPIDVFNGIIDYYTRRGTQVFSQTPEGKTFFARAWEVRPKQVQTESLVEQLRATPLGLSPQ